MRWTADGLDDASWRALMTALGSTPHAQARAYEALRERLRVFFRSRAAASADRLADEVLSRLANKLASGVEVERSIAAFALGMARLVWLEHQRQEIRDTRSVTESSDRAPFDHQRELQLTAMESCLERLAPRDREDLTEYHRYQGRMKTGARRAMAERTGVTANALRLRMMRLRRQVSECIETTLATWDGSERHSPGGRGEGS